MKYCTAGAKFALYTEVRPFCIRKFARKDNALIEVAEGDADLKCGKIERGIEAA